MDWLWGVTQRKKEKEKGRYRGGGDVDGREIGRQKHRRSSAELVWKHWQAKRLSAAAASGVESVTRRHTATLTDKPLHAARRESWGIGCRSGLQSWSEGLTGRMRSITWLGVRLSTCSGRLSTPAVKETGADGGESCWDYAQGRELQRIPHLWQKQQLQSGEQELWLSRQRQSQGELQQNKELRLQSYLFTIQRWM